VALLYCFFIFQLLNVRAVINNYRCLEFIKLYNNCNSQYGISQNSKEMNWCIDFKPPQASFSMGSACPIYLAGSCFAFEWGNRLNAIQWPAVYHPLHISYQAQALQYQLKYILGLENLCTNHWVELEGRWRHLNFHSSLSDVDREVAEKKLKLAKDRANAALQKAEYVIITLGTARSYTYLPTGKKVANCHKLPKTNFSVQLEDAAAIERQICDIQHMLSSLPRFRQAIWTVSPVRHLRSGLIENQRSKARLITAVEQLTEAEDNAHYFPAYEWLIDVLRDYRFYAKDLTHPSDQAVEFILQQFSEMYFSSDALQLSKELEQYYRFCQHRPKQGSKDAHQKKKDAMKTLLENTYPQLQLD